MSDRRITESSYQSAGSPVKLRRAEVLRFVADIKGDIAAAWKRTLEEEGFGRLAIFNGIAQQSVQDELDSLLDCLRQRCYYGTSEDDVRTRRAFLCDYAAPYFSKDTLQDSILPTDSFVKRVIRRAAMLYKDAATRWVDDRQTNDTTPIDDAYGYAVRVAGINQQAKEWLRKIKLSGCVLVRPVVRPKHGRPALQYDHYTPDVFRVLVDDATGALEKVCIATSGTYDGMTQNIIKIWTADTYTVRASDGDVLESGPNEYGFIPFVLMRIEDGDIYDGAATDLVDANLYCNYLKLLENTDATYSAVNVFIHRNLGLADTERIGMRQAYGLNGIRRDEGVEAPSAEFVSGTPHMGELRDLMLAEERNASMRHGMPALMLSDNVQEISGKAMKIAMAEQLEARQDDAAGMEECERECYVMTADVLNWHRAHGEDVCGLELPNDPDQFNIDFAEVSFQDDPKLEYELDMAKAKDGIISIASVARKDNPDAESDEELLDMIARNKATMKRFEARGFKAALLNAVKPDAPNANAGGNADANTDPAKQGDTSSAILNNGNQ